MIAVVTMTPLHMKDHGHATLSLYVIAFHIVGMYGLSPLVGRAVGWWRRVRAIGVGAAVLGSGTVIAILAGYQPWLVFVGLFLLGLDWSFGVIAGNALLGFHLLANFATGLAVCLLFAAVAARRLPAPQVSSGKT